MNNELIINNTAKTVYNFAKNINISINKTLDKIIYFIYDFKVDNVEINITLKENVNAKIFVFLKNNVTLKENIYLNTNSTLNKIKVTLYNLKHVYFQNIYLNKYANFDYETITLVNEKANEKNQIEVYHQKSNSISNVVSKCLIKNSRVETNCVSNVDKNSSNCVVLQNLRSILLDRSSLSWNRPILNIFNKNVVAKHGCSIGKIDETEIYYLKTRGFNEQQAKKIICMGYFKNVLSQITNKKIYNLVNDKLMEELTIF